MRKRTREFRIISNILALTMILTLLSACSSKNSAAEIGGIEPSVNMGYGYSDSAPSAAPAEAADGGWYEYEEDFYDPDFNTEEYRYINENRFMSVETTPLSTFSSSVDTASYANVRRFIENGHIPPIDAIRIEEMINYFNYDYANPSDNEPFSVTVEIAPCPWNSETELVMIGMQAEKIDYTELPSSNFVFLIDVSGSMDEEDKLPLVKRTLELLVEQLRPNDTVSIVTYAGSERVVLEGADGTQKSKINKAIKNLASGGSTAGSKGIITAYEIAQKYFLPDGNNRVILATDGDLNVGITSEGDLKALIEEKRDTGVFLSVLGFGEENIKDNKMQTLAQYGNGNYSYIDGVTEANKVLVEEMTGTLFAVAKDVKFQVEFNPAHIKGYRLVGYENRLMNAEDFADDEKDGGEVGAGHRVTVLYEIVRVGSELEVSDAGLKYQGTTLIESDELFTVSVRYKDPEGDTSILLIYPVTDKFYRATMSDNMLFASAVAQVGMIARGSEFVGDKTYADVLKQLENISRISGDVYKSEFLDLVKKLQRMG